MVMRSMLFVWRSPDARGPRLLPGPGEGVPDALVPVPGIRVDVDRGGLCWGRHEADPDQRWWRVFEAAALAVAPFPPSVHAVGPSVQAIAFEQRVFRCDGKRMGVFLGPGVDAKQVEQEVQAIQDGLRKAAQARSGA